jgi:hypothetical protein
MAFNWVISQLDSIPSLDGMDKVISTIHYRAQKQYGVLNLNEDITEESLNTIFIADYFGALRVDAPHEASFTPYNEVTKEMVESWLEAGLDCEAIEANLDSQIENFLNPPLVAYALPWSDPAKI